MLNVNKHTETKPKPTRTHQEMRQRTWTLCSATGGYPNSLK